MQNLEDYTPEMLVFYQNLPAPVQNAVRHADVELEDLDSLAVFAENLAKLYAVSYTHLDVYKRQ